MKRDEALLATRPEDHDLPITSAVSGALIGATMGILGGVVGIAVAAVTGAVFGALGGLVLERQRERFASEDSDDVADAAALIEPPRTDESARHPRQHPSAHLHYSYPQSFGVGSMLLRP